MRPFLPSTPWRLDPRVTFLNHGSFGARPEPVIEAQRRWRERMEAEPIRFLDDELEDHLDAARAMIGDFLNADPDGIAFMPNATSGVATVLGSLRFAPGDELLTTDHEYNATLNALAAAARRDGARVVVAKIPFPIASPQEALAAIVAAATPRTRLALISHLTSPTGIILPIDDIVRELDRRGVDTIVDGAHGPGSIPVDVARTSAAYWTGNGHKWLCAPIGSAVLHVRGDRREAIHPLVTSHGANDPRTDRSRFKLEFDWPGTFDPSPHLAMADAIKLVGGLDPGGWPAIMAANQKLALEARDLLARTLDVEPPAPDAMLGGMAALPIPGLGTDDDAARLHRALLEEDRIQVPIVGWPVRAARDNPAASPKSVLIRISAQRYNEPADYERLARALERQLPAFAGRRLTAE
jgi:isopenicillin-N epimerase